MVFRIEKTKNYTVMSKCHLKDNNLSLKAKGLLSVMLSLPDTWDYSIAGLVAICKENESAIKSALTELKQNNYLTVEKLKPQSIENPDGTKTVIRSRIEYQYTIYETPHLKVNQDDEIQHIENQSVEFQSVENHGQLNTNKLNTKKVNTNTTSNDVVAPTAESFDFGKPKKSKQSNNSEYDKAIDLVKTRYSNPKLVSVLSDYVTGKKEQAGKLRHRFSSVTIKTYLDELDEICESDSEKIEAVRLSINYNFTSKVMKPFTNGSGSGKSRIEQITGKQAGATYYENEDQNFMEGVTF